jgi:hypothetical protein
MHIIAQCPYYLLSITYFALTDKGLVFQLDENVKSQTWCGPR